MPKKGDLIQKVKILSDQNQMLWTDNKKMVQAMKDGAIHVGMLKTYVARLETEVEELKMKLGEELPPVLDGTNGNGYQPIPPEGNPHDPMPPQAE